MAKAFLEKMNGSALVFNATTNTVELTDTLDSSQGETFLDGFDRNTVSVQTSTLDALFPQLGAAADCANLAAWQTLYTNDMNTSGRTAGQEFLYLSRTYGAN